MQPQHKIIALFVPAVLTICLLLCTGETKAQAQKKQLTASNVPAKIALLDHARLRKEYKALRLVADSAQHQWMALKNENEKKQFLQKRDALMQQYELKIREAIAKVVGEGGYTDVQPIYKDKPVPNGTDITDKVLNKLN